MLKRLVLHITIVLALLFCKFSLIIIIIQFLGIFMNIFLKLFEERDQIIQSVFVLLDHIGTRGSLGLNQNM